LDREVAASGELQVVAAKDAEEEAGWQEKVKGEGVEDICDKAYSDAESYASAGVYQSEERRQPRCKITSEIPMALKSPSGV
jgi:hypothetical protein